MSSIRASLSCTGTWWSSWPMGSCNSIKSMMSSYNAWYTTSSLAGRPSCTCLRAMHWRSCFSNATLKTLNRRSWTSNFTSRSLKTSKVWLLWTSLTRIQITSGWIQCYATSHPMELIITQEKSSISFLPSLETDYLAWTPTLQAESSSLTT